MKPFHATRAQLPTSKGYSHVAHPVRDEGMARDACSGTRAAGRSCGAFSRVRVLQCWQGADEHGIVACEDSHCEDFTISIAQLNADQRREARRVEPVGEREAVGRERLWEKRGCGVCGAFSALSRVSLRRSSCRGETRLPF
jgi:hypothetical protein